MTVCHAHRRTLACARAVEQPKQELCLRLQRARKQQRQRRQHLHARTDAMTWHAQCRGTSRHSHTWTMSAWSRSLRKRWNSTAAAAASMAAADVNRRTNAVRSMHVFSGISPPLCSKYRFNTDTRMSTCSVCRRRASTSHQNGCLSAMSGAAAVRVAPSLEHPSSRCSPLLTDSLAGSLPQFNFAALRHAL
jgi:hypothetical protein